VSLVFRPKRQIMAAIPIIPFMTIASVYAFQQIIMHELPMIKGTLLVLIGIISIVVCINIIFYRIEVSDGKVYIKSPFTRVVINIEDILKIRKTVSPLPMYHFFMDGKKGVKGEYWLAGVNNESLLLSSLMRGNGNILIDINGYRGH